MASLCCNGMDACTASFFVLLFLPESDGPHSPTHARQPTHAPCLVSHGLRHIMHRFPPFEMEQLVSTRTGLARIVLYLRAATVPA